MISDNLKTVIVWEGYLLKKEYYLSDAKFIYSKDELGYQEVLNDFKNAEEIIIVTFNIRRNSPCSFKS